jgi:hypothetical protein
VEYQVFCVLHLRKWILEKDTTFLAREEKLTRIRHTSVIESYINAMVLENVTKMGHWECPVKKQKVGNCSFTDGRAQKVELKIPDIIVMVLVLEG